LLSLTAIYGSYLFAVDAIQSRTAMERLLGRYDGDVAPPQPVEAELWRPPDGREVSFPIKEPGRSSQYRSASGAAVLFVRELVELFGPVGPLLVVGLWRRRQQMAGPAHRCCQAFALIYCAAVLRFASATGYIEARHLLPLAIIGLGATEAGIAGIVAWSERILPAAPSRHHYAGLVTALLLLICLLGLARPLHPTRLGHRLAGNWLAGRTDGGLVLDTRGWTGLYSGRETLGYDRARWTFADPRLAYVVIEQDELGLATARSQTLGHLLDLAGTPVVEFTPSDEKYRPRATVVVYRWHPERFAQWLANGQTPPLRR
jgi:hypothetical protein